MTRKHPAQELEEDVLVRASDMGDGHSDYEAFHTLSPAIHLREIHTHDFFELYIHLSGFPRLYATMSGWCCSSPLECCISWVRDFCRWSSAFWTAHAAQGIIISWMRRRFRCVHRALTAWRRTRVTNVLNRAWRIMPR